MQPRVVYPELVWHTHHAGQLSVLGECLECIKPPLAVPNHNGLLPRPALSFDVISFRIHHFKAISFDFLDSPLAPQVLQGLGLGFLRTLCLFKAVNMIHAPVVRLSDEPRDNLPVALHASFSLCLDHLGIETQPLKLLHCLCKVACESHSGLRVSCT
jgi:hypothetical protein